MTKEQASKIIATIPILFGLVNTSSLFKAEKRIIKNWLDELGVEATKIYKEKT